MGKKTYVQLLLIWTFSKHIKFRGYLDQLNKMTLFGYFWQQKYPNEKECKKRIHSMLFYIRSLLKKCLFTPARKLFQAHPSKHKKCSIKHNVIVSIPSATKVFSFDLLGIKNTNAYYLFHSWICNPRKNYNYEWTEFTYLLLFLTIDYVLCASSTITSKHVYTSCQKKTPKFDIIKNTINVDYEVVLNI